MGGLILSVSEKTTKKGDLMGVLLLEDSESSVSMVAFPRTWAKVKESARVGVPCVAEGKMDDREQLLLDKLTPLSDFSEQDPQIVRIRLRVNLVPQFDVKNFARALRGCRGASPILLELRDDHDACVLYLNDFRVDARSPERLHERLLEAVPAEALEVCLSAD